MAAHSNYSEHGKSTGRKADDIFIAYACAQCHAYIDSHKPNAKEYWSRGFARTLLLLIDQDLIKIR